MIMPCTAEPTPTPRGWWSPNRMARLLAAHQLTRRARYRNDFADDWTPDLERDCQGKTAWLLEELGADGWLAESMRGYVCEFRPLWARIALPMKYRLVVRRHAFFLVRVTLDDGSNHDVIADIRKRHLVSGIAALGYLRAWPAVAYQERA